ncbi:unnamed protein product [Phytophthora fragariaefolia]|uniref:Unnamed protein product n=1 Tax=Phytophthora fragariaefolia TaxID=1490495 RepID=A0A9W6U4E9_9STRA|nr:unnamed protein product [Phytophthora fragariaefolia]
MLALEAKKNEGNALFQQQRFAEAANVYTSVLDELRSAGALGEASARLEMAVRLNRAWAWIQMPDSNNSASMLAAAEQDCSAVLERDPSCVKAYYRRALALERRGHWRLAMEDVNAMMRLEPCNPSVGTLLERLQQRIQGVKVQEEDLDLNFQQCAIESNRKAYLAAAIAPTAPSVLADEAEDAWRSLQADEKKLHKFYHAKTKPPNKPRKAQKDLKVTRNDLQMKGEISEKTDDVWASLRRKEATTVAKAFPRSRKNAPAT